MIKNATYGSDRGVSYAITVKYRDGTTFETPKRWTREWLKSLSNDQLHRLSFEINRGQTGGYWSVFNFRTLANRQARVYEEIEIRRDNA